MVENESLLKRQAFAVSPGPRLRLKPVTVAFLGAKFLDVVTTWIAIGFFGGWEIGLATGLLGFKMAIAVNVAAVIFAVAVLETVNFRARLAWIGPAFAVLFPLWNIFVIGHELLG